MGEDYSLGMDYPLGQRLRELPGPILLTGHTGFKGTWMTFLLEYLDVAVVGYSLPAEKDSLFDLAGRIGSIPEELADIRDYNKLEEFIDRHKPSAIIHMAAQALVLNSYENPRETFDINVMGTVNLLDIAFKKDFVKSILIVTTDKVYRNDDSGRAFIETDPLEGKDPYSASKVGTEAVVAAWQQLAIVSGGPRVISVRAGNVIGGGDLARNRIIPDLVRGFQEGFTVEIRNPKSTRPWQHVNTVNVSYLGILEQLEIGVASKSVNIGPVEQSLPVSVIVKMAEEFFSGLQTRTSSEVPRLVPEADQLRLDPSNGLRMSKWVKSSNQIEAIRTTFQWWKSLIHEGIDPVILCKADIKRYLSTFPEK